MVARWIGFVAAGLVIAGCTAGAADEQEVESSEQGLANNGLSNTKPYDCDDTYCTCTGDVDCNQMFSDGVCGAKAICQISPTDVPKCRCSIALKTGGRRIPVYRADAGLARSVR